MPRPIKYLPSHIISGLGGALSGNRRAKSTEQRQGDAGRRGARVEWIRIRRRRKRRGKKEENEAMKEGAVVEKD